MVMSILRMKPRKMIIMVMSPVVNETSGLVGSGAAAVSTQLLTRGGGGGGGEGIVLMTS